MHTVGKIFARGLAPALLAALGVGCAAGTYPVEGRVVFGDGTPARELSGSAVEFRSLDVQPAVSARGLVRDDGSFSVTTHRPRDGAVAGRHGVLLTPPIVLRTRSETPEAEAGASAVKQLVDPRFTAFETSGLEVAVEKRANVVTLTVERPPR